MIRFFASHPTAASLMMLIALLAGLVTLPNLKRETMPQVKSFEVRVQVAYPGAAPLDVEKAICLPLEDATDGIAFIDEKSCEAKQSTAIMTLKMLQQGDFSIFIEDINSAVDAISDFPVLSKKPVISELNRTQAVVKVALTADIPRSELKDLTEYLKQEMLKQPFIPLVNIEGFSDRQIQIKISSDKLRQHNLSLQQLADIVTKQNIDLPLGSIETAYVTQQLRFNDEKHTAQELAQLAIIKSENGTELTLADIATITDSFELNEQKIIYQNKMAAFLAVSKNNSDDSLNVLANVKSFIAKQQQTLPAGVSLSLTEDNTSIVNDRINLLLNNAWQGLLLVFAVMWLFFSIRYAFWVVMGLPVSFLASFYLLGHLGVTINMISMVALLLSLGILMDDAIVISESIGVQIKKGKQPLQAAIDGTAIVARGVLSSFATTLCLFIGLVFIEGDIGQVLRVIPIVLICVISVSLLEAFFVLPSHLYHSLQHAKNRSVHPFRIKFEHYFERVTQKVNNLVIKCIHFRYAFIGSLIACFFISLALLISGVLKFSAFPNTEGDLIQARIQMPAGTPLKHTEQVVDQLLNALQQSGEKFQPNETSPLLESISVNYSQNADAFTTGPHLATINVNLLTAQKRSTHINRLINDWRENTAKLTDINNILFKEPMLGPSGRAVMIRLSASDLSLLADAAQTLKTWFVGYQGVDNVFSDLHLGSPEYTLHLKAGAFALGLDAQTISKQIRAAFQGIDVLQSNGELDTFFITVKLDDTSRDQFSDFDNFPIVNPTNGALIPLEVLADIELTNSFSRINRINNQRTVTLYGDVDAKISNTKAVIADFQQNYQTLFLQRYPQVKLTIEGEIKNAGITQSSMKEVFIFGLLGVFILLSLQFKSYLEPVIVLLAIPLALIGVIWGHMLMGLDFTMPSILGFVALAGIVVNDSILLVEFVKKGIANGMLVHDAAAKASSERFRAILLTSVTTIAGMTPLLFETSLQAQILIPLVTSIVFGIFAATLLVLFAIPALYTILEDFKLTVVIDTSTKI